MSLSPISSRYSTAVTLMQQLSPGEATKRASGDTNDILKIANGLSTAPGAAAKQASGRAFDFAVSQAVRGEAAQKADEPGAIVMAGIGGGDAVERFDSWEAFETRIRTDGTLSDKEKNEWLEKIDSSREISKVIDEFTKTDQWLALKSGDYWSNMSVNIQKELAASTSISDMKAFLSGSSREKLI